MRGGIWEILGDQFRKRQVIANRYLLALDYCFSHVLFPGKRRMWISFSINFNALVSS